MRPYISWNLSSLANDWRNQRASSGPMICHLSHTLDVWFLAAPFIYTTWTIGREHTEVNTSCKWQLGRSYKQIKWYFLTQISVGGWEPASSNSKYCTRPEILKDLYKGDMLCHDLPLRVFWGQGWSRQAKTQRPVLFMCQSLFAKYGRIKDGTSCFICFYVCVCFSYMFFSTTFSRHLI